MQFNHIEDPGQYAQLLAQQPDETKILADDLLIIVTSFFRDAKVFDCLEREVIPALFERKTDGDEVRVWTPGCATGEEAYSLAILLLEAMEASRLRLNVQVFASDLHVKSLSTAREGFFSEEIEKSVGPVRLKRFFHKENGGYRIRNRVRECIVFAPHNLLTDPPFSRLDLVSCRNLLIYLQRDLQRKVIELFHYSLNPSGFLVLGTSETCDSSELFRAANKDCSVYSKRNVPTKEPRLPVFPLGGSALRNIAPGREQDREPTVYHELYSSLLEQYAPPSLLICPDDSVSHLSPHIGLYLGHPAGPPTTNVAKLIHPDLRIELRTVLAETRLRGAVIRSAPLTIEVDSEKRTIALIAIPAAGVDQEGFVLLVIEEQRSTPAFSQDHSGEPAEGTPDATQPSDAPNQRLQFIIDGLQADQNASHRRLEALIAEHEASQEALKASNEELQSANEELRSTLEELETSKEELQSINEELQTVNQENHHRMEELALLSGDLQNLLAATSIATLFLDRELRIQRFTPKTTEMFNVRHSDRGRPISDITHRLGYDELREDAERVLAELSPIERVIQDDQGRSYLTRVLAYRSADDHIAGTVITFVDITERIGVEQALRISEAKYKSLFNSIGEGFVLLQAKVAQKGEPLDFNIVEANPAFEATIARTGVEGTSWRQLFSGEDDAWFARFDSVLEQQKSEHFEYHIESLDLDTEVEIFCSSNPGSRQIGVLLKDITKRKRAEEKLRQSEEFHRLAVEAGNVGTWSREAGETSYRLSARMASLLGHADDQIAGIEPIQRQLTEQQLLQCVDRDDRHRVKETFSNLSHGGQCFAIEFRVSVADATHWIYATGGSVGEPGGPHSGVRGAAIDITERKNHEEALHQNEHRLGLELAAMKHLHALVARLLKCPDQAAALSEVVASAVEVTGAKMGCIQTFDSHTQKLSVAAGRYLPDGFDEYLDARQSHEIPGLRELRKGECVQLETETGTEAERRWALDIGFSRVQASPLISRSGDFLGAISTYFDSSWTPSSRDLWTLDMHARQAADLLDRIEAQVALQHSEAQFRAVFEVSAAAAVEISPATGEILRLNEAFSIMTGFSAEESLGRSFMDFVAKADHDSEFAAGIVFNDSGNYQKELRLVRKDGTMFWGLITANLVALSSPARAMVLMHDVTSRRDAELSLEEQNRHKDEFIAMLGHELRNPLAAIRNATDVLRLIPSEDRRARRAHNALHRQSRHMSRLIDGLLEISRIARGKVTIAAETVDLKEILETVLEDRETEIKQRGLTLIQHLPDAPVWLSADPSRMAQVFDNLLGNSIKFTPSSGTITTSLELDGSHCVVKIIDTGRGMRPEVLSRVFEAFHQDEQDESQASGGLGLGLALAKGLLDLHHGTIRAYSAGPGRGSELVVRLPITEPPCDTGPPPAPPGNRRVEILIVEDNQDACEMFAGLLELQGHGVKVAECAEVALELLRSFQPDLIFCDIGLPGMTGLEFARTFRAQYGQDYSYLVALTGCGQPRDREKATTAGFNRHLVKPLDATQLHEVLTEVSRRSRPVS